MQINIKATKIDLTDAIRDYVEEKMNMLEKYLGDIKVKNCDVEVGLISNHHQKGDIYRTEVNLQIPGEILRVEKTEQDLYKAIDKVKDHLMRSIKRYKQKMIDKNREGKDVNVEELMEV
ncbi:ribosome-associated translation inhibitor RaiA [Candidatus Parcubacteria bacterium]|nr:ribosome-associated translation inhibitor RaiA [Candidatus Parcubacteria bacterium]